MRVVSCKDAGTALPACKAPKAPKAPTCEGNDIVVAALINYTCMIIFKHLSNILVVQASLSFTFKTKTIETVDPTSRFYVDDGCHTEGNNKNKQDDYVATYELPSFEAGVRCCSMNGTTCDTFGKCPGKSTYCDAVRECEGKNMRVCTKDELLSEVCCGSGGDCDNHPVWTSTLESGDYLDHYMAIVVIEL